MSGRKKLKVAFAMGGGASLGAFSGGAIGEVMRQLHRNLDRDTYDAVEVDVLSGASAGGMTLGLLVRGLADPGNADADAAVRRVAALMREAWVERIGIEKLIPDPEMTHVPSLVDRGAVDEIAKTLLQWPAGQVPRRFCLGDRVCLGLTLLNYNGIPISLTSVEALKDALSTTLFRDYRVFCLDFTPSERETPDAWLRYGPAELGDPASWWTIAATAIAGGAVPLAFETVVLRRSRREFGDLWPDTEGLRDLQDFPFTHGDGGTFNNEPLREAMRMIGAMDSGEDPETFDRVLISIDPNVSGDLHVHELPFHRSHDIDHDTWGPDDRDVVSATFTRRLAGNAARILAAIRGQASFKDYLAADKVNNRLRWRDDARGLVRDLVEALPEEESELASRAGRMLEGVLAHKKSVSKVTNNALESERELHRVHRELFPEQDDPAAGLSESWRTRLSCTLFALLDQVSALRRKQPVTLYAVGPTKFVPIGGAVADAVDVSPAGDFAQSFGGFLHERYRAHDYELGRAVAGSVLAMPAASGPALTLLRDPRDRPDRPAEVVADLHTDPAARALLAARLGFLAQEGLRDLSGNPLVTVAAAPLTDRVIRRAVENRTTPLESAVLCVRIRPREPDHRFHLRAAGRDGDDSERAEIGPDGTVSLYTVVLFPPGADGTDVVEGPHVGEERGTSVLDVRRFRRALSDPSITVPIPSAAALRATRSVGTRIHRVEIDWDDETGHVPSPSWSVVDGLTPLEEVLGG